MKPPTEKQAAAPLAELLSELFGSSRRIRVRSVGATERYDYVIDAGGYRFLAEYKGTGSTGTLAAALDGLVRLPRRTAKEIPLLVVPHMGEAGRQLCDRTGVSWLDLCGNARIVAPGLRIWIEGRSNKYVGRGRPPNVFASKSSRIVRRLLLDPRQFHSQANLARAAGLGDGYVSKIVRRLKEERYIEVNSSGAIRPFDADVLLDAWQSVYDFGRHRLIQGHVPARSGEELLQRVVNAISKEQAEWALTGLSAAWLYCSFAAFRLVTVYVSSIPTAALLRELAFSDEPSGANLWIALPDDDGVFQGCQVQQGFRCVSAVQTYLDLKSQPERAKEAAVELRREHLNWAHDGS